MDLAAFPLTDAIGWTSSGILLATVGKQVHKQWQEGRSEGVSRWLFIGQIAASIGFTIYSWLVNNWVFVVTNALMLGSALVGYGIVVHHRRRRDTLDPTAIVCGPSADDPNHHERSQPA